MGRVRVHQHVNPLAPFYRFRPNPVDVAAAFANPELPLLIDLGCARGRFLLKMARLDPVRNFLGVEIREPLVEEANRIGEADGLKNLHYEFCNAMLELDTLLSRVPAGLVDLFTIQFPDPWFKKKHAKRRMVNEQLVRTVAQHLAPGGRVFIQTDIEFLADEMFALFRQCESLRETDCDENPFPVKTEREQAVEDKSLPVYRRVFQR